MTVTPIFSFERSVIDEERFGVRTARAFVTSVDEAARVVLACATDRTELLVVRCPAANLAVVQALEEAGARLMDTLLYYSRDVAGLALPGENPLIEIRMASPDDSVALGRLARLSFRGYSGHYHADPRLDRDRCDEVYASWAEHSATSVADSAPVFIALNDGSPVGFITVRMNSPTEAEIVLNAVSTQAQKRGIYPALVARALHWSRNNKATQVIVSTQVTNLAAQKVWCRLRFEPSDSYYTLHLWF
jgi:ribosomal protein S18 acetylase RimI-like enzyme